MNTEILDEHLKNTVYLYFLMLLGQISFFIVSIILVQNSEIMNVSSPDNILRVFVPLIGIMAMVLSRRIYDKYISGVQVRDKLEDKLRNYRKYKIIQWALIEGAGFLALVFFFITRSYLYAIIFLFLIGYYILLRPTKGQLITDMKI